MSQSFQNEIPRTRINISLNLHMGGAQQKIELPLTLLPLRDFDNGKATGTLSER